MSKLKNPKPGLEVPPRYKFNIELDSYRRFTMAERLKILFGYRAVISVNILTCHSPGQYEPSVSLSLTGDIIKQ